MTGNSQPSSVKTFADLISALENGDFPVRRALTPKQRDALIGDTRRFFEIARTAPSDIEADPGAFRKLAGGARYQDFDITAARWSNIKSSVRAAMAAVGLKADRSRRVLPLNAAWSHCRDSLATKADRDALSRFMGWASAREIDPAAVTLAEFEAFEEERVALSDHGNPRENALYARRAWNRACRTAQDWPGQPVPQPSEAIWKAPDFSIYPDSLGDQLDHLWKKMGEAAPFDNDHRPLRQVTIDGYRTRLRVFAGMLVEDGVDPASLSSVEALLDPELVKRGLTRIVADGSGGRWRTVTTTATALVSIARHAGLPGAHIKTLQETRNKAQRKTPSPSLTALNKGRLAPLKGADVLLRFIGLPAAERVATERAAAKGDLRKIDLNRAQTAAAMEILLTVPLRASNLAKLRLGKTMIRMGAADAPQWRIVFEPDDMKSARPYEAYVSGPPAELIAWYVDVIRPQLSSNTAGWLFPSDACSSGHKTHPTLRRQLQRLIKMRTGLQFHAHLFRHFAVMLYLREYPTDYETPRRLLGHASITTTTQIYAELGSSEAIARYDQIVLRHREDAVVACGSPQRRRARSVRPVPQATGDADSVQTPLAMEDVV